MYRTTRSVASSDLEAGFGVRGEERRQWRISVVERSREVSLEPQVVGGRRTKGVEPEEKEAEGSRMRLKIEGRKKSSGMCGG
jgi:hypothetical protein